MIKPKVVILGGGFGGLTAARAMAKTADVTVVDRHNFQTFLPLLYQVSTAGLAADHVAYPIRGALRKTDVKFRMGSPISIDHKNKEVKLDSSEILKFDHLVIALGSTTADFGIPGVKEFSLGMKSVHEAVSSKAKGSAVIVSHGDVIKSIVASALGMHLDEFQRIVIDPASISILDFSTTKPRTLLLNDSRSVVTELLVAPKRSKNLLGGGAGR